MKHLSRLLTLTLALIIAVTSQQMAVARGMTHDAAGQVILCTGQGAVKVTLDRNGDPMGPVHFCPDCALILTDLAMAPAQATPAVVHIDTLAQSVVRTSQTSVILKPVQARGPPLFV